MRDEEDLTLEAVPGFDRPMSAGPEDRIVGEDELGRMVYETITGQRYTISRNPDQRTARARFEEDTLPAMQEYLEDPRMPTASEAAGFVGDVVSGAYESLESAVQGRGTIGDVAGLAVGSGAGSMFGEVPEGSLRLFGGFRAARDPGRDAERQELPQSVGADELPRFEIDDSQASFNADIIPQQNMSALNNAADRERISANPGEYFVRLDQILDHPELYRQYPELRDLLVVEDVSLRQGVGGSFDPDRNLLSISSNIARDPDYLRGVLLHEVQHAIQELEGFDRGTNQRSAEVASRADPAVQEATQMRTQAREVFDNFDYESRLEDAKIFIGELLDEIESDGLVTPDEITFSTPHRTGWDQSLEVLADRLGEDRANPLDSYETLLDFYALIRDNPNLVVDEDAFESTFGVGVNSLSEAEPINFLMDLETAGVVPIDPDRLNFLEDDIRRGVYESRSGEVEARNVQERLGMSLAQRFNESPESTEDVPRGSQWRVDDEGQTRDVTGFSTGGVVDMDEQMSLFEMGGLTDDGATRDPVSGNEVPPGSMASEVRDDVPAMLSEGEYVVPADVVRYYGVKFFEDLRGQAKSGLTDMERTGRIGGEPVDPTPGDEPLTDEELQMLAEIAGMATGGMVTKGYQEGGSVSAPFTPMPNYNIPGFSLFSPTQAAQPDTTQAQTQTVTLYGPSCEVVTVSLPNEQASYDAFVQQGYSTQPRDYCMAAVQREQAGGGEGGEPGGYFGSTSGDSGRDYQPLDPDMYAELRDDPLAFGAAALEGRDMTRLLGGVGMLLNPILGLVGGAAGAAITARNVAQAQAAVEVARAKGLDTSALEAQIEAYISNLPNGTRIASNIFADGSRIAERFFNTARDLSLDPAVYGPNPFTRDWFETDEAFATAMQESAPSGMTYDPTVGEGTYLSVWNEETNSWERSSDPFEGGGYRLPDGTVAAPTSSPRPTPRPGGTPVPTTTTPRVTAPSVSPVVEPPTATSATPPLVTGTVLPTEDIPEGSGIVGDMATPEEAAAVQPYNPLAQLAPSSAVPGRFGVQPFAETNRVLSEQDINDLQAAGIPTIDVIPGDFATLDQARFLSAREAPQVVQPYTPSPQGAPMSTQPGQFYTPGITTPTPTTVDVPTSPRQEMGYFGSDNRDGTVTINYNGVLRTGRPGEQYRNYDGTIGVVPGIAPPMSTQPGQFYRPPTLDEQVAEAFGQTPKPTTPPTLTGPGMLPPPTRATTTQPFDRSTLVGSNLTTTLPSSFDTDVLGARLMRLESFVNNNNIPKNTVVTDPRTGRPTYYDTTTQFSPPSTGFSQNRPEYSYDQPGFQPSNSYLEAMNRLSTGQTPKPTTPADLRGPGMLPPPTTTRPRVGYGVGQIDPRLAAAVERYGRVSGGTGTSALPGGAVADNLTTVTPTPLVSKPTIRTTGSTASSSERKSTPQPTETSGRQTSDTSAAERKSAAAERERQQRDRDSDNFSKPTSRAVTSSPKPTPRPDKDSDGGGGGGGGKIVCTAMNEAYGFGSYRQAVWLKYSQDNLTPYHEKGYHKIFLPLVDRAYNRGEDNNLFLRKVLENIARHRTADLRAEMQGKKRDTLGRAYRAILEPVCYIVGRLSK